MFQQKIHFFGTWSKNVCPALDPRLRTERFSPAVKASKNSTSTTPERPGHSHGHVHGRTWHSRLLKATCANMHLSLLAVCLCLSSFSPLFFFFFKPMTGTSMRLYQQARLPLAAHTHTHAGSTGFIGFKVKHYCIPWEDTRTRAYQAATLTGSSFKCSV